MFTVSDKAAGTAPGSAFGEVTLFELAVALGDRDRPRAWLVRVVSVSGMGSAERAEVAAYVAGRLVSAPLLGGAVGGRLADLVARATPGRSEVVDVTVSMDEALSNGLTCAGSARILLQPASDIGDEVWRRLVDRQAVCLVTDLVGDRIGRTRWVSADAHSPDLTDEDLQAAQRVLGRGMTDAAEAELSGTPSLVAAHWPTPRLLVLGEGLIAQALSDGAAVLDWDATVVNDLQSAEEHLAGYGPGDGVVILSHDRAVDAPVLAAALASRTGYVAALGSRHTQAARAGWLRDHGVSDADIGRVRGPAGLDIGSRTPAEIMVSIVAEMIAARGGIEVPALSATDGPIHRDGVNAPPARHSL